MSSSTPLPLCDVIAVPNHKYPKVGTAVPLKALGNRFQKFSCRLFFSLVLHSVPLNRRRQHHHEDLDRCATPAIPLLGDGPMRRDVLLREGVG